MSVGRRAGHMVFLKEGMAVVCPGSLMEWRPEYSHSWWRKLGGDCLWDTPEMSSGERKFEAGVLLQHWEKD